MTVFVFYAFVFIGALLGNRLPDGWLAYDPVAHSRMSPFEYYWLRYGDVAALFPGFVGSVVLVIHSWSRNPQHERIAVNLVSLTGLLLPVVWTVGLVLDWDPMLFIAALLLSGLFAVHLLWR